MMIRAIALTLACTGPVAAQTLFAVDSSRALSTIDATTGAKTLIGTVTSNAGTTGGLAADLATGTVYLTSTSTDSLYTLDLATGAATLVGPYGDSSVIMHGLEFDSSTDTLYGASSHNNGIYTIDRTSGAATLIGTTGLTSFTNLVHDPFHNVLYATNSGTDSLYVIDRATGAARLVGALNGPTNPNGLAWDLSDDRLCLVCNTTDTLYYVDTNTGAATMVGSTGAGNLLGLVFLPGGIARTPHGCGQTTIDVSGLPFPGGTVTTQLGGVTGLPLIGLDFAYAPAPLCTCTIGHGWSSTNFGPTLSIGIPTTPVLSGLTVAIQGADFLGVGGCPAPQLTLTDTFRVTVF